MREARWIPGPNCPPQAENRCPGKAHKQGEPCKRPVRGHCSDACPNCGNQWLREDCFQMEEHSCQCLFIQAMQDQARIMGAKRQQETVVLEAQRAEQARLDREGANAVIADVQERFEADRIALTQAASRREQELMEQVPHQTAAAQQ
eukprot:2051225-Pyramimonas_sp.AAC.1